MTIGKHQGQQQLQKNPAAMQTINTSYGNITVPTRGNKMHSPGKVNAGKKKGLQSDQALMEYGKSNGKNKKAANGRNRKREPTPQLQVNMDARDLMFDQMQPYNDLALKWGSLEDEVMEPAKALAKKKQQRKVQMSRRREKLPDVNSILKNPKAPQITIQTSDDRHVKPKGVTERKSQSVNPSSGKTKAKKQVSIKEEKILLSPASKDKGRMHKNKNTSSDANIGVKKLNSYVSGSEFTISSIGKEDKDNDSNSIISEEDSAFDDCSPAQGGKTKMKKVEGETFGQAIQSKEEKGGMLGIQGNARNANISINAKPQSLRIDAKVVNRQKTTIGSKTKREPIQRSPTHKSRNGQHNFTTEEQKLKLSRVGGAQDKSKARARGGDGRLSRNSSLNLPSEHQTDQLSVNFGKSRFVGGRKQSKGQHSQYETLSVQSIITKGGTVINPFSLQKDASKKNIRSLSRFDDSHHNLKDPTHSKARLKEENSRSRFKVQPSEILKPNLKIGGDDLDEDLDLKKSMQKAKMKMMQVYLKAPYQVLTINEIKLKQRENYSPIKLFRAENNLVLHTVLRSNQHKTQKVTGNKLQIDEVGEGAEDLLKGGAFNTPNHTKTHANSKKAPSQMSEANEGRNGRSTQHVLSGALAAETEPSVSNHVHTSSRDNILLNQTQQLSSYKLKQLKQQKLELESNFKQVFYDQLHEQFDKKIEQVNLQNNLLKKQKDLFSCYGPSQGYSATLGALAGANLTKLLNNETSFAQTGDLGQLERMKSNWLANTNQTFHITDGNQNEEANGRAQEDTTGQVEPETNDQLRGGETNLQQTFLSTIRDEAEVLKSLVDMSTTMGFSKRQMEKLRRQKRALETAEKSLDRRANAPGKAHFPKQGQTASGSFTVDDKILQMAQKYQTEKKISFYNQKMSHPPTKTTKMPPLVKRREHQASTGHSPELHGDRSQQSLSPAQLQASGQRVQSRNRGAGRAAAKHTQNTQSIDNNNVSEVKDYFSNKISLRRSIEHKLHYDNRASNQKGGGTFRRQKQDSLQKHSKASTNPYTRHRNKKASAAMEVLDGNDDLGEFGSPQMGSPSQLTKGGAAGAITIHPRTHMKTRTMAGPELHNLSKHAGTLLPQIQSNYGSTKHASTKRAKGQDRKDMNDSQSDAACPEIQAKNDSKSFFFSPEGSYFPLKKSGTHVEKDRQPIRQQKDSVIMAFAAQNLMAQHRGAAGANDKRHPHQLGYQYMNKSPRLEKGQGQAYPVLTTSVKYANNPQRAQNSVQRIDASGDDLYNSNNLIIAEGGPTHGAHKAAKHPSSKQSLMLKGVLSQQRRLTHLSTGPGHNKSTSRQPAFNTVEMINNYPTRTRQHPSSQAPAEASVPSLPDIAQAGGVSFAPGQ